MTDLVSNYITSQRLLSYLIRKRASQSPRRKLVSLQMVQMTKKDDETSFIACTMLNWLVNFLPPFSSISKQIIWKLTMYSCQTYQAQQMDKIMFTKCDEKHKFNRSYQI